MSTKTPILTDENFNFYHESFSEDEIKKVIISVTHPSESCIEKISDGVTSTKISLSSEEMDKIAVAWIRYRKKLQSLFGGPVGKEYGSPERGYD